MNGQPLPLWLRETLDAGIRRHAKNDSTIIQCAECDSQVSADQCTEQELIEGETMITEPETYPMVQCAECGEQDEASYVEPVKGDMIQRLLCFDCLFWIRLIESRDEDERVVVEGTHYIVCDENAPRHMSRGFGGSLFVIRFFDGREVRSTNLWCQGKIPERFKERLPDNAEFARH